MNFSVSQINDLVPTPLLECIVDLTGPDGSVALCPNFELGSWRHKRFADHLFDWLPDAALKPAERLAMLAEPNKTLAHACRRVFDVEDPDKRGEIGEILLHAMCRQQYHSAPFVARLFYKMRSNDSVTSIDVAHVLHNEETGKLELWLGEAKLYSDMQQARYAALASIKPMWEPEFLQEMKALVGPKVDPNAPYADELSWLFADETSLDEIIDRIVVPICIAADFDPTKNSATRDENYLAAVKAELEAAHNYFENSIPDSVKFVVILVPLDCKEKVEGRFHAKVQSFL